MPVAAGLGVLTFAQLCLVGVAQTAGAIAFGAASGAHLKALVPPAGRMQANARLETVNWVAQTAGPPLGGVLINAMLFGGPVMMVSALLSVLMLRDLGLSPGDYGLALGLPCLGGVAGSRLAPVLRRRVGQRRLLLASGIARAPWMLLIPLAPRGAGGLALIVLADTGLRQPTRRPGRLQMAPPGLAVPRYGGRGRPAGQ